MKEKLKVALDWAKAHLPIVAGACAAIAVLCVILKKRKNNGCKKYGIR